MIEAGTERGMIVFSEVGSPLADAQEVCSGHERAAWACRAIWIASNLADAEVVPPFRGSRTVAAVVPDRHQGNGRRDDGPLPWRKNVVTEVGVRATRARRDTRAASIGGPALSTELSHE